MRQRKKNLGKAFPDQMIQVDQAFGHFKNKQLSDEDWKDSLLPNFQSDEFFHTISPWRLIAMTAIFLIIFLGLFIRLFHLQVIYGAQNRDLADSNRIRIQIIHAPRGVIYDRNGQVLAENDPGFRLYGQFISRDKALKLEAQNSPDPNDLEIDTIRSYPYGESLAHILGYVGQISPEQLKESQYQGYRVGDRIGLAGIEKVYESVLKGTDGAEIIEVDAQGKKLQTLREIDPIPGQNVYLSIDLNLQQEVFNALKSGVKSAKSCCGAAVVEDPKTGEVLALASYPSFDDNAFTDPKRQDEVSKYLQDPDSPLLNRVIAGTYPPGSTFKIVTSLAGLSSGKINAETQIEDTGIYHLGPYSFANWYYTEYGGKTEGMVNLVKAIARSNDIYFYHVGEMVGQDEIKKVAQDLGMGKQLGIDLPGEASGLVGDDTWKEKNVGVVWYPGDTLHLAIGQGYLLTTPLQIMAETGFIADNGVLLQPHLVTKITGPDGGLVKTFNLPPLAQNLFKQSDIDLVQEGMKKVPQTGGTAWPFFNFSVPTAGKTGSAEFGDPKDNTHAWYTSYAPANDPKLTTTVLVEAGGEGSNVAAPITKDIYTWYFNPDKSHIKSLDIAPIATESAKVYGE